MLRTMSAFRLLFILGLALLCTSSDLCPVYAQDEDKIKRLNFIGQKRAQLLQHARESLQRYREDLDFINKRGRKHIAYYKDQIVKLQKRRENRWNPNYFNTHIQTLLKYVNKTKEDIRLRKIAAKKHKTEAELARNMYEKLDEEYQKLQKEV
jgi:hypothetical protein